MVTLDVTFRVSPGANEPRAHGDDVHTLDTAVSAPRELTRNSVAPSACDGPALTMVLTYWMVLPGLADAGPVLVSCTSASCPAATVLDALLLAGFGSVVPLATAALAVLARFPTNVALPPAARSTVVPIAPTPDSNAHADPAVAVHVHVTPLKTGENASVTETPAAMLGPLLATVIVHANGAPAAMVGALGVFTTETSATIDAVSVALAASFAGFGSTGALDTRVAVFTSGPVCVTRPVSVSVAVRVTGSAPTVQAPVTAS